MEGDLENIEVARGMTVLLNDRVHMHLHFRNVSPFMACSTTLLIFQ